MRRAHSRRATVGRVLLAGLPATGVPSSTARAGDCRKQACVVSRLRLASAPIASSGIALPDIAAIDAVAVDALPAVVATLAALQTRAAARLLTAVGSAPAPAPAEKQDPDQLLTTAEASALLALPTGYVAELGRRGDLPRVARGKYVRFRVGDLRAWIARHREATR